ncbi:VENN motif pre-toxin domain-containing protein [Lonsdalea quercina]|uniref:VENN motif pre-toxin domain-containing protein n=1 Tax=Lonsdalea quercina TaxID=71657 RepID=UPI003975E510
MDVSSGRINNEYRAVVDQSGLFAGKGGFDIFVGGHTQLEGAVIASDAEAAKNRLSTDTLGWSDIENWAESSGNQYALSVSGGVGKSTDSGGVVATTGESQTGGYQGSSGGKPSMSMANFTQRVTSTTHSAVAEGEVLVRDSANQQQDVATLNRDTEHAHSVLENNFDRNAIRDKLEIQQQATSLGTQAMTAYAESQQNAAKQQARDEMAASGELEGLSEAEIEQRVLASETFKAAESEYGVGSPFWTAGTSVSGLLAGVLGGNVQSGAAAGAAPVLAKLIKDASGDNEGARIALHTLASAVLAKAQGGNATAGAAGGFIAAASAKTFAQALYGKEAEELAPDEKMVILNLVSALGAAGGGLATGDTSGIVSAGNAARVEVENNYLSSTDKSRQTYLNHKKSLTDQEKQERDALNRKDAETSAGLIEACMRGSASACNAARQDALEKQGSYQNLSYQNPKEAQEGYQQIQQLLIGTGAEAKQTQELFNGMVAAYMRTGMTEEAAKSAVGYQLGTMYIIGGIAGIGSGKVADEGLTLGVKSPSFSSKSGGNTSKSSSETYFRVEGGGSGTQTSQNRINVNADGSVSINSGCSGQLCVSTNGSNHAAYYLTNKRQDGSVVVFEVDVALHKQIMEAAVPQRPIPGVPKDPNAPKIVDPTKGQPSISLELPKVWDRLIEQNSSKARVLTKEEFLNEFGK